MRHCELFPYFAWNLIHSDAEKGNMIIELSLSSANARTAGARVYVNTDYIETMRRKEAYDGHLYTDVCTLSHTIGVVESPEEIMDMINSKSK